MNKRRVKIPDAIENQMKLWRMGAVGLPQEYIEWHKELALKDLPEFAAANGLKVWGAKLVDDGWCDGMKFVAAVVENANGKLFKIKWADGQRWYHNYPNRGGWGLMSDNRDKEGEAA